MMRKATEADMEFVLDHAEAFHSTTPYRAVPFDREAVTQVILGLLAGGVIFVNDKGFIAGQMANWYFNPSVRVATELAWWCPEGDGQELQEAFEDWAIENGAQIIQFSILNNDRSHHMANKLNDLGYRAIEVAYVKGVS